jgi:hypothetical protein
MSDVNQTEQNMREKLEWAERSLARMKEAKLKGDDAAVQDHFWSLLHACRLIWFYLGEFVKSSGDPNKTAKKLMDQWQALELTSDEQEIFKVLADLRTEDVHTKPVSTDKQRFPAAQGGQPMARRGQPCAVARYFVEHNGKRYDAFGVAQEGVRLWTCFVKDFSQIV